MDLLLHNKLTTATVLVVAIGAIVGIGFLASATEEEEDDQKRGPPKKRPGPNEKPKFQAPSPPPEGFDWYINAQFGVGISAPVGWLSKEEGNTFSITEKPHEERRNVGVTVTYMPKQTGDFVSQFLKSYLTGMEKAGKVILTRWQRRTVNQVFSSYNCMYMDMDIHGTRPDTEDEEEKENYMTFVALIYNENTGSIWMCSFEAVKEQFQTAFPKYGQVMLNNMFFSPSA
jgi:hypothetical protein